jgi:hypothetical protein
LNWMKGSVSVASASMTSFDGAKRAQRPRNDARQDTLIIRLSQVQLHHRPLFICRDSWQKSGRVIILSSINNHSVGGLKAETPDVVFTTTSASMLRQRPQGWTPGVAPRVAPPLWPSSPRRSFARAWTLMLQRLSRRTT